jgi:hypothetical protein
MAKQTPVLDDIGKLNARVAEKTAAATGEKGKGVEFEEVRRGAQVYHRRFRSFVYGLGLLSLYFVTIGAPSVAAAVVSIVLMYFWVDLYGAVLHVVLDNPKFIRLPGIDAGCLEFQWHHHIPSDITRKEFVEVCGDLNGAAAFHVAFIFGVLKYALRWDFDANLAMTLMGAKALLAYFGQYSHRMAHTPESQRPAVVKQLQAANIMLPAHIHKKHHDTYDGSFPILSGHTNNLISSLLEAVPNDYAWLGAFVAMTMFDVVLFTKVLAPLVL